VQVRVKKNLDYIEGKTSARIAPMGEPMDTESSEKVEVKSKVKDKPPLPGQMFVLKKWNAVAMWSWDVECDTCAICRVQVMGEYHVLLCFVYTLSYLVFD